MPTGGDKPPHKPTLVVDFDGVLNDYSGGYMEGVVLAQPTEGAREWLETVSTFYRIVIVSSRFARRKNGEAPNLDYFSEWMREHFGAEFLRDCGITWQPDKPPAWLTLDDRAVQFLGPAHWPTIRDMQAFRPWHQGQERDGGGPVRR